MTFGARNVRFDVLRVQVDSVSDVFIPELEAHFRGYWSGGAVQELSECCSICSNAHLRFVNIFHGIGGPSSQVVQGSGNCSGFATLGRKISRSCF